MTLHPTSEPAVPNQIVDPDLFDHDALGSDPHAQSIFDKPLAAVLFATPAPINRAGLERRLVARFRRWLTEHEHLSDDDLRAKLLQAEHVVLAKLSGENLLRVLRLVEAKRPSLLMSLPTARTWATHMQQARVLSDILNPVTLGRLVAALKREMSAYGDGQ